MPDIDAREVKIHSDSKGASRVLFANTLFGHRRFIHSLIMLSIVLGASIAATWSIDPLLGLIFSLGYASYIFIDGFNTRGVMYLYPWNKEWFLFPRAWRTPVNGGMDHLLFVLGAIGVVGYIFATFPGVFESLL